MEKKEIYKHTKGMTDNEREKYFNYILERQKLLSDDTIKNIESIIVGINLKRIYYLQKEENYGTAAEIREKIGHNYKARQLYELEVQKERRENPNWPNTRSFSSLGLGNKGERLTWPGEVLRRNGRVDEAIRFYLDLAYECLHGPNKNIEACIGYYKSAGKYRRAKMLERKYLTIEKSERAKFLDRIQEKRKKKQSFKNK